VTAQLPALPSHVEGRAIPAAMRKLEDALRAAEWRTGHSWGYDTGGDLFVTLEALSPDGERKGRATWHTRRPGIHQPVGTTLRLFSCMLFEPYRGWRDLPASRLALAATTPPE
jgi:hypothetical protein